MNDKENLQSLTNEELQPLAYHLIRVSKLYQYCNPFDCWLDLDSPITEQEIIDCLARNEESLEETPNMYDVPNTEGLRKKHIQKIAYFVKHDSDIPIDIDVGSPNIGFYNDYIIEDGNHRFAAKIIKKDKYIKALVQGTPSYARELGLWKPTEAEKELNRRYREEWKSNKKKLK